MNHLQWYDFVRLFTALLSVIAAYRLGQIVRHRLLSGHTYSDRMRDFLWLIFAYLFLQFTGTIESVQKDSPWKYTTFLGFMIALVAIRATRKSDSPLIT